MTIVPPLPVSGRPLPCKVVIRLLPPLIEESQVLRGGFDSKKSLVESIKFVPGNRPDRPSPENPTVNSRMYIQFKSFQAACDFIIKFHGTIFQDDKGDSFRAVAAFAPYQRDTRPGRQLQNALDGSFEGCDHFQTFIEKGPDKLNQEQFIGITKKAAVAPLVAALAERNARLNEEIEKRRAAKASSSKKAAPKKVSKKAAEPTGPPKQVPKKAAEPTGPAKQVPKKAAEPTGPPKQVPKKATEVPKKKGQEPKPEPPQSKQPKLVLKRPSPPPPPPPPVA
jgi:hypothetical protein